MRVVSISGLDGSGKSTQIELLKTYLENQGKKIFYFHAIQFGIANKISGLSLKKSESEESKSVTKANCLQIFLRKVFLRIDIRRFGKLIKKLEKKNYDYILTDRYFYDSIVNIEFLSNSTPGVEIDNAASKGVVLQDSAYYKDVEEVISGMTENKIINVVAKMEPVAVLMY